MLEHLCLRPYSLGPGFQSFNARSCSGEFVREQLSLAIIKDRQGCSAKVLEFSERCGVEAPS